jgi:CheY-like chemotaxis protein
MVARSSIEETERVHPTVETAKRLPELDRYPDLTGVRVLVIDDEPDTRALLGTVLQRFGAEVRDAVSAAQGLSDAEKWKPMAIVCDIGMPGEDGYSFIQKLRESERASGGFTPAVALTAYARTEDRLRALSSGFQIHVAKPIEPVELALVVSGLLAARKEAD